VDAFLGSVTDTNGALPVVVFDFNENPKTGAIAAAAAAVDFVLALILVDVALKPPPDEVVDVEPPPMPKEKLSDPMAEFVVVAVALPVFLPKNPKDKGVVAATIVLPGRTVLHCVHWLALS